MIGGSAPGVDRPLAGTITLVSSSGDRIRVKTADGAFRVHIAPGTYRTLGTSPMYNGGDSKCTGALVLVSAHHVTQADVNCEIF
jgi:hypothetical protein